MTRSEKLTVPFSKGVSGVTTAQQYKGKVTITITGTAQASGVVIADAFYFYAPLSSPTHRTDYTVWIDGKPVDDFVKPIPHNRGDHTYVFTINAPGGHLTFGVGSGLAQDGGGSFTVVVTQS